MNEGVEQVKVMVLPDGRVDRSNSAKYLGKKAKTLAEWKRLGIGPRQFMVGGRSFCHIDDLRAYASGSLD